MRKLGGGGGGKLGTCVGERNIWKKRTLRKVVLTILSYLGADLGFSRGGGGGGADLWKNFQKLWRLFLGRPTWFSKLSPSSQQTLFWPKFLRRRQSLKKQAKKGVFRHLLESFDQKVVFFRSAPPPPLKISIYWLLEIFSGRHQK